MPIIVCFKPAGRAGASTALHDAQDAASSRFWVPQRGQARIAPDYSKVKRTLANRLQDFRKVFGPFRLDG
jgi:hypothetical protein